MNPYTFISFGYGLLDKFWLGVKGINPRNVIAEIIPNKECKILDMCCGTLCNSYSIALKNNKNVIVGIDRSKAMLRYANNKIKNSNLDNVEILCKDALNTELESNTFDYIIIGLILHECDPNFRNGLLNEAKRLLKEDGKIIVLDWDKQNRISRKFKFLILYLMESIGNPKYFKEYYESDKKEFFEKYGLKTLEKYDCNYSFVSVMEKQHQMNGTNQNHTVSMDKAKQFTKSLKKVVK